MTDQVGVRDAVRQLGRAVGTLVRAVVGAVRRPRPASAPSGPPQEWLDLVAETDPEWLARSQWAGRGARKRVRPARPRETEVEVEAPPSVARQVADVAPAVGERASEQETYASEPVEEGRPRRETRTLRQPRLVPVEDAVAEVAVRPRRAATEPVPLDPPRPPAGTAPLDASPTRPVETGPLKQPAHDTASPPLAEEPWSHAYSPGPTVRTEPDHPRHETAPLPAHISELGTWSPREAEQRRPTPTPPATAPTWPELPPTSDLDDVQPGLASRLWSADAPDALTLAQRRS